MTAYSVPIPTTFRDVSDQFIGVAVGAPKFEFLNQIGCKYTITLEMMIASLLAGIDIVSRRAKSQEALHFYELAKGEVKVAHQFYLENEIAQAQQSIFKAQHFFHQAANKRSRRSELRFGGEKAISTDQ